ncbi:MAG: cytochrome c peroxidase [Anaerolineales bacterium]|nr:MAG: cytochrome c peroxidase [Anaerolineales bacterium]
MKKKVLLAGVLLMLSAGILLGCANQTSPWSEAEEELMRTLWIESLPALPPDPTNQYADDPRAVAFGAKLFSDTRFSSNNEVSCATCHIASKDFQDGLQLAQGVGTTDRRTMPIAGTAYSPWLFWDGRKDSQWAQALGPLENPVEHGGTRTFYVKLIQAHYKDEYEVLFGALPDFSDESHFPIPAAPIDDEVAAANWTGMSEADREAVTLVYVNMGKAIAAFERTIMPGTSRFDLYVEAVLANDIAAARDIFTPDEGAGLKLFLNEANCTRCHNGPLLTDNDFHNTGVPALAGLPEDTGRTRGALQVLADEFNCLSRYSDAAPEDCKELRFMLTEGEELERAFKTPSLRDVANRAPFMHAGQFATLEEVLNHYHFAPASPSGHSELEMIHIGPNGQAQLVAFLKTLTTMGR